MPGRAGSDTSVLHPGRRGAVIQQNRSDRGYESAGVTQQHSDGVAHLVASPHMQSLRVAIFRRSASDRVDNVRYRLHPVLEGSSSDERAVRSIGAFDVVLVERARTHVVLDWRLVGDDYATDAGALFVKAARRTIREVLEKIDVRDYSIGADQSITIAAIDGSELVNVLMMHPAQVQLADLKVKPLVATPSYDTVMFLPLRRRSDVKGYSIFTQFVGDSWLEAAHPCSPHIYWWSEKEGFVELKPANFEDDATHLGWPQELLDALAHLDS